MELMQFRESRKRECNMGSDVVNSTARVPGLDLRNRNLGKWREQQKRFAKRHSLPKGAKYIVKRQYESKPGGGTWRDADLMYVAEGFSDLESVQRKCDQLSCAYYTWCNNEENLKGVAWFYKADLYDSVDNAAILPKWIVGRPVKAAAK